MSACACNMNGRWTSAREMLTRRAGAVHENCWLECGLSVSALDIESLSFTSPPPASRLPILLRAYVRACMRAYVNTIRAHTRNQRVITALRCPVKERERERGTNFEAIPRPIVSCINARQPGRADLPPRLIPGSHGYDYLEGQTRNDGCASSMIE